MGESHQRDVMQLDELKELFAQDRSDKTAEHEAQCAGEADVLSSLLQPRVGADAKALVHQPIVVLAPPSAMSVETFIEEVEKEEDQYFSAGRGDTHEMITRLRKIFYDRKGWDEHLISGAEEVAAPYTTVREEIGRVRVKSGFNGFDMIRSRYRVICADENVPAIAENQEIMLLDSSYADLGHVLAGLDAANHPQDVGIGLVGVESNLDAVTWVGDLGSVLAETQIRCVNGGSPVPPSEVQPIIDEYAPGQDMLGNIDPYVIARQYDIHLRTGGVRPSEILRNYYLVTGSGHGPPARQHRYSTFARAVKLGECIGSQFEHEAKWMERYVDEVNDAAALYVLANAGSGFLGTVDSDAAFFALGLSRNEGARPLVLMFLKALKSLTAQEP